MTKPHLYSITIIAYVITYKTTFGWGYIVNCPWQRYLYSPCCSMLLVQETMVHVVWQHITIGFNLPWKSSPSLWEECIFGELSNSPFPWDPITTIKPLQLVYRKVYVVFGPPHPYPIMYKFLDVYRCLYLFHDGPFST